jgi:sugar/nucleoside kinase (ribokinase family)
VLFYVVRLLSFFLKHSRVSARRFERTITSGDEMKTLDVTGIGNGLVDIFADIAQADFDSLGFEKGTMRLVSSEEQHGLLERFAERRPAMCSGGSVANSMIAVAQLGGKSAICCRVADDQYGRFYRDECAQLGVRFPVALSSAGSTGTCVSLITPDAERTMRTSLGVSLELAPSHIDRSVIRESQWVFIEGYVFSNSDSGRETISEVLSMAKAEGTKVAVTCSDAWIVSGFGEPLQKALESTSLLFANEEESAALAGASDVLSAGRVLKDRFPYVVLTAGARGAYLWWEGEEFHVPAFACTPRDLTGAGDMFAGAFLYGMTHGLSPSDAAHRACFLASKVISQIGARLTGDIKKEWLLKSDS